MEGLKQFTLKSATGCKRVIGLLVCIILVCSFLAQMITTNAGRVKTESITIDKRGATLSGDLMYPSGTTDRDSYPAVITVPGAGVEKGVMKGTAEELARRGYVVLNLDPYGTGESETPAYNENGQGVEEYDIFATPLGVLDALDFVRALEFVDSENIGIVGHSQGSRRAGYAALMDCGYYTFNDIMLNVLYEVFDQPVAAEDLSTDADLLAGQWLDEHQLAHYTYLKAEYRADYDTMCKSICLIGSTAQYVNPIQTVEVAGIPVERTCKVNIGIINGTYDYGYVSFSDEDTTKEAWYLDAAEQIELGAWYALDDLTASSAAVGAFRSDTVISSSALARAIQDRTLRMTVQVDETHSKNFFSRQTTAMVIDYFSQTLGNGAEVSTTSSGSIIFMWRELLNFIALLAMIGMCMAMIKFRVLQPAYESCGAQLPDPDGQQPCKLPLRLAVFACTVVSGFGAIYLTNNNVTLFTIATSNTFPLMLTAWSTVHLIVWMAVASLAVTLIFLLAGRGVSDFLHYLRGQFTLGVRNILKSAVIALSLFVAAHAMAALCRYLFMQDFRLWMVAFTVIKADYLLIGINYALLLLPFYWIISLAVNYLSDKTLSGLSENLDCLVTAVVNSLGIWLCCLISFILAYGGLKTDGLFSSFILTYGSIIFIPIVVFLIRKSYKLTHNVWIGAVFSSLLAAWMLMSISGTNGAYYAQNWFSNFLGL